MRAREHSKNLSRHDEPTGSFSGHAMTHCSPVSSKGRDHPEDAVEQLYSQQQENQRLSSPAGVSKQAERRASFQKTANRYLRRNQKKTFDSLKEAAKSVESPARSPKNLIEDLALSQGGRNLPEVLFVTATMKTTNSIMATKIQTLFRGFNCRKNSILRKKRDSSTETASIFHRRGCSEITMSDWSSSDSFCSLGSLELSPRTNMRTMNQEVSCCHHMNSSSCTTMTMMLTESEDSFSSIFSSESVDHPVQRPRRKLTPPPPPPPPPPATDGGTGKSNSRRHFSPDSSLSPGIFSAPMTPDDDVTIRSSSVAGCTGGRRSISTATTNSLLLRRVSRSPLVSPETCGTHFPPMTPERNSPYTSSPTSSPSVNKGLSHGIPRPPLLLSSSSPERRSKKKKFVPPLTMTPARSSSRRRDDLTIRATTLTPPSLPFKGLSSKQSSRPRILLTPERSKSKYVLPMTPEMTPIKGKGHDDDDWKKRLRIHMMKEGLPLTSPRAEARINQNCNVSVEGHASMNSLRMSKLMGSSGCGANDTGSSSARRMMMNEWGNASFSSYFAHTPRDEPIKAPRRKRSPIIQSKKISSK